MLPSFPCGKHCFQCQFLFSRCKICLRYTAGNLNENPSMRALAKILRARASQHSSNFCEQFKQRPNFASTFKLDGTFRYPYLECRRRNKGYPMVPSNLKVLAKFGLCSKGIKFQTWRSQERSQVKLFMFSFQGKAKVSFKNNCEKNRDF